MHVNRITVLKELYNATFNVLLKLDFYFFPLVLEKLYEIRKFYGDKYCRKC